MKRILSKGSNLPFVHESVGWDESTNFKDYDIVFVNLRTLEETSQDYDHPYNESENSPCIFDSSDVRTFLQENGYMIVYLPDSPIIEMGNTTTEKRNPIGRSQPLPQFRGGQNREIEPYDEYDTLEWLPFSTTLNTEEKGESVEVLQEKWKWYFGNEFRWDKIININTKGGYEWSSIAKNSYGKRIALRAARGDGHMCLIPPKNGAPYSEFIKRTLEEVFDIESGVKGRSPPSWLSEFTLPEEEIIEESIESKRREIEALEEELECLTEYKDLLYETNTRLEETTRRALRELGFTVEDEIPGKRDGILHTERAKYVLEITGTTGGIKLGKCRQLDEWVENVIAESPDKEVSGLLIVNPEMDTNPEERDIRIEPNVEKYMKRRGDYKVLTTLDLYKLVEQNLEGSLDKEEADKIFDQDSTLLSLPEGL